MCSFEQLYISKAHCIVTGLGNPSGRLNQGLGVRKVGRGRENLKLSLRKKEQQLGSQERSSSLTHEQDCQGLSSKCFPVPWRSPCSLPSSPLLPLLPRPRHARVVQAAFGCGFLLIIRVIAPESCFATPQSSASYHKGGS